MWYCSITWGSSRMMVWQTKGSVKLAAPTSTAVAPASISSITSRAQVTPPCPQWEWIPLHRPGIPSAPPRGKWPGRTCPCGIGQEGLPPGQIQPHPQNRVDEADAIGACCFTGSGNGSNVCDVGGQLDNHRLVCDGLHRPGDFCGRGWVCAKAHTAAVDVGAADVHLQPTHLFFSVQPPAHLHIILHGKAGHIGHTGLWKYCFIWGSS